MNFKSSDGYKPVLTTGGVELAIWNYWTGGDDDNKFWTCAKYTNRTSTKLELQVEITVHCADGSSRTQRMGSAFDLKPGESFGGGGYLSNSEVIVGCPSCVAPTSVSWNPHIVDLDAKEQVEKREQQRKAEEATAREDLARQQEERRARERDAELALEKRRREREEREATARVEQDAASRRRQRQAEEAAAASRARAEAPIEDSLRRTEAAAARSREQSRLLEESFKTLGSQLAPAVASMGSIEINMDEGRPGGEVELLGGGGFALLGQAHDGYGFNGSGRLSVSQYIWVSEEVRAVELKVRGDYVAIIGSHQTRAERNTRERWQGGVWAGFRFGLLSVGAVAEYSHVSTNFFAATDPPFRTASLAGGPYVGINWNVDSRSGTSEPEHQSRGTLTLRWLPFTSQRSDLGAHATAEGLSLEPSSVALELAIHMKYFYMGGEAGFLHSDREPQDNGVYLVALFGARIPWRW